jgi:acetyltransferase-like isoleucine patch superfamily enzyme
MNIYKLGWIIRRVFYACIFNNISFYGYLGSPVVLIKPSRLFLKPKTRIFPGSRFEVHSRRGSITVNENCSIGQNFHCTAIGNLEIGRDTVITANVCITDIHHDYQEAGITMAKQKYIHRKTAIGNNCFIGFGATILAGSILGKNCVVGANSVVIGAFPEFSVIAGNPARIVKKLSKI